MILEELKQKETEVLTGWAFAVIVCTEVQDYNGR